MQGATPMIKLLAHRVDGRPVFENVPAEPLGHGRFRLLASPGFAPGAALGDEVELSGKDDGKFVVVSRSGNVCVQVWLARCGSSTRESIERIAAESGGTLDGGVDAPEGNLLIFNFHINVGFPAIERAMAEIARAHDVDRWMYGNVYSTQDGTTPLNWWL